MGKQKGRELCLSWTLDLFPDGGIQPQVWEEPKVHVEINVTSTSPGSFESYAPHSHIETGEALAHLIAL